MTVPDHLIEALPPPGIPTCGSARLKRYLRFGCPRIARIISRTFGVDIDKNVVCRVLSKHSRPTPERR